VLGERGLRLVLCGKSADGDYTVERAMGEAGGIEGVEALGYVPDADLPLLVAGARALVFPSFAEGFGRPVLEALASGVAVVASDIAPLREVAGEEAEWVDPREPESIAEGIRAVLAEDGASAASRRDRGLARAGAFTPERFAHEVLAAYDAALGG
jgi:alpha-1,3-rhamnosyl/mannosyltransferase